jgi:hypothetical protein
MTDLHNLLARAVDDPIDVDTTADLRRGRRALNRRRTRVVAGVTGGLVAAGAWGYVALPRHQNAVTTVSPADGASSTAPVVHTTYYQVPQPPAGWHVVGERPQYLMISRDGTDTTVGSSFIGQIIVGLTDGHERFDTGPSVQQGGGRTVYVNDGNPGVTILSVRTSPGGPWLQAQYPNADLELKEMVDFLDGVVVGPDAEPALG